MALRLSILLLFLVFSSCDTKPQKGKENLPNIVYILADDLGYGDVSLYNPDSKIATPNIDRFGTQGMRFTDAHSPSSVCTPTRYGILTGRYCWRTRLPKGVLQGYGQSLIEAKETTVAELLKRKGYETGVVGKWHLGLDWNVKTEYSDSIKINERQGILTNINSDWIDFSKSPENGPLAHGFDYSYILPASLDMDPYCYLENDVLVTIPDDYTPGNDLNTGSYATGAFWRAGRMSKGFDFYEVLPTFIQKANNFIQNHANKEKPFFLYLPLAAPHTPWVPKENYIGKSQAGQYGDFAQMVDEAVGKVLDVLSENGLNENTVVIFTSDNGPFWKPEFIERYDHHAAYIYRGMKMDVWDGGHRIPFIVRWPGKIKANSQSNQLTTLTNLIATVADITENPLQSGEGMDSESILPVLLGAQPDPSTTVIHHSSKGMFAIRSGDWKYIDGLGSGGFSTPSIVTPKPGEPDGQLYNMKEDPSESKNIYQENQEKVKELKHALEIIKTGGN